MAIDFDKIDRSVDLKGLQADVEDAKKNLVKIPVINGTIPHKQEQRFGGSLVMIRPAAPCWPCPSKSCPVSSRTSAFS